MEINISHQMRSEILNTMDLTNPNLFKRAVSEAVKMMQMVGGFVGNLISGMQRF